MHTHMYVDTFFAVYICVYLELVSFYYSLDSDHVYMAVHDPIGCSTFLYTCIHTYWYVLVYLSMFLNYVRNAPGFATGF